MLNPLRPSFPQIISLEPTSRCNLRCVMCPREVIEPRRSSHDLSYAQFVELLARFPSPRTVTICGIAEPLLNPETPRMIAHVRERGALPFLITNGTLLDEQKAGQILEAGVERVTVSFHGVSPQVSPAAERRAHPDALIEKIRILSSARDRLGSKASLIVNLVAMSTNADRLADLAYTIRAAGASSVVILRLLTVDDRISHLKPTPEQVERLIALRAKVRDDGSWLSFWDSGGRPCDELWTSMFVHANGDVYPCDGYLYDRPPMGNLFRQDLPEIWDAPAYRALRKKYLTLRMESCRFCAKGGSFQKGVPLLLDRTRGLARRARRLLSKHDSEPTSL